MQAIAHETRQAQSQTYYAGDKESEVPAVRQLLQEHGLCREKVSLAALHCKPLTLELIAEAGGIYLVGLKENQPALLAEVKQETEHLACLYHSERVATRENRVSEVSNLGSCRYLPSRAVD